MKKFIYFIFGLGILYACSIDTLVTEQISTTDAKSFVNAPEEISMKNDIVKNRIEGDAPHLFE